MAEKAQKAKGAPAADKATQSRKNYELLEQAQEELTTQQERELIADYDAALAEWKAKQRPYYVRFNGKEYAVPRTQPFSYTLFVSRHTQKVGNKVMLVVPDDKQYEYIRLMLGDEFVEALGDSQVELEFVQEHIVKPIHAMWQGGALPAKNAQTPGS